MKQYILSPKAKHLTKKRVKNQMNELKKTAKSKKDIKKISENILAIEDAHPRRARCAYVGEMVQMDASVHNWFGNDKTQLPIAVDDATGSHVGAYFAHQETLNGYYNVLSQMIDNHVIPFMFLTDRRTVFKYVQKKSPSVEEDTFFKLIYQNGQPVYYHKGTSGMVIKAFNKEMFFCVGEKVYALDEIPVHEYKSKL